jgi:hypothetical protein
VLLEAPDQRRSCALHGACSADRNDVGACEARAPPSTAGDSCSRKLMTGPHHAEINCRLAGNDLPTVTGAVEKAI